MIDDDLRKRIDELEELIVRLANRIYLAHEVLANRAERKTVDLLRQSDRIGSGGTVASDPTRPLHHG